MHINIPMPEAVCEQDNLRDGGSLIKEVSPLCGCLELENVKHRRDSNALPLQSCSEGTRLFGFVFTVKNSFPFQ